MLFAITPNRDLPIEDADYVPTVALIKTEVKRIIAVCRTNKRIQWTGTHLRRVHIRNTAFVLKRACFYTQVNIEDKRSTSLSSCENNFKIYYLQALFDLQIISGVGFCCNVYCETRT